MKRTSDGVAKFSNGDYVTFNNNEWRVISKRGNSYKIKMNGSHSDESKLIFYTSLKKSTWRSKLKEGDPVAFIHECRKYPAIVLNVDGDYLNVQVHFTRSYHRVHRNSLKLQISNVRLTPYRLNREFKPCCFYAGDSHECAIDSFNGYFIAISGKVYKGSEIQRFLPFTNNDYIPIGEYCPPRHVWCKLVHKYPIKLWKDMIEIGDGDVILEDIFKNLCQTYTWSNNITSSKNRQVVSILRTCFSNISWSSFGPSYYFYIQDHAHKIDDPVLLEEVMDAVHRKPRFTYMHRHYYSKVYERPPMKCTIEAKDDTFFLKVQWNGNMRNVSKYWENHALIPFINPSFDHFGVSYSHTKKESTNFLYEYQVPVVEKMIDFEKNNLSNIISHTFSNGYTWTPVENTKNNSESYGGILCLDPGLGKTVCTLGLFSARRMKTLIIAPVTICEQWKDEVKRFLPYTEVAIFHGNNRTCKIITIISYATFVHNVRELDYYEFDRIVFDESHKIKINSARFYKGRNLKAKYRWCLTATPITSGWVSLYSQCALLNICPCNTTNDRQNLFKYGVKRDDIFYGFIKSKIFKQMIYQKRSTLEELGYIDPIATEFHTKTILKQNIVKIPTWTKIEAIEISDTHPLLLDPCYYGEKNVKQSVDDALKELSLPDIFKEEIKKKIEEKDTCPICLDSFERPTITSCGHLFCWECCQQMIRHCRRCPNCRSALPEGTVYTEIVNTTEETEGFVKIGLYTVKKDIYEKLEKFPHEKVEYIKKIKQNCIVVSKYKRVINYLREKFPDTPYISGSMAKSLRDKQIRDWKKNPKLILLHTKAADVGISLQEANNLVIMDRLNRNLKKQVIGRIKRIGQTKNTVHVHEFNIAVQV